MRLECCALASQRSFESKASTYAEMNRILEASCMPCLRRYLKSWLSFRSKKTTASAPMAPFFVPPKESTSTPRSRVACGKVCPRLAAAFVSGRHPYAKTSGVRARTGQGPGFHSADRPSCFRRLGDGNYARLHVVFVANPVVGASDGFYRELSLSGGNWDELAAGELLWRTTLVGVNVGLLGANHGMVGLG